MAADISGIYELHDSIIVLAAYAPPRLMLIGAPLRRSFEAAIEADLFTPRH